MDTETTVKFTLLTNHLRELLGKQDPDTVMGLLLSLMGNIVGQMDDDLWRRLQHAAEIPCGQPHCSCHIYKSELFHTLEGLRERWIAMRKNIQDGAIQVTTIKL